MLRIQEPATVVHLYGAWKTQVVLLGLALRRGGKRTRSNSGGVKQAGVPCGPGVCEVCYRDPHFSQSAVYRDVLVCFSVAVINTIVKATWGEKYLELSCNDSLLRET